MPTIKEKKHQLMDMISELNDRTLEFDPEDREMENLKGQIAALKAQLEKLDLMEQAEDRLMEQAEFFTKEDKVAYLSSQISMLQDEIAALDEMHLVEGKDAGLAAQEAREKMQRLLFELRDLGGDV